MAETLNLGTNGNWATKKESLLAYNDENNNFKPLPFNFTRDSSATRVNKEGLIEVVSNNEPRIDFKDSSEGALLLEPQRTNVVPYSEDFENSAWNKIAANITPNNTISPDGTQNSDLFVPNSSGGQLYDGLGSKAASAISYTTSLYVKPKGLNSLRIYLQGSSNANRGDATFNLSNQTVSFSNNGAFTDTSASILNVGNGWYRCILVTKSDTSTSLQLVIRYDGSVDNISGLNLWGCQTEQGSYATSYIPTSGSAVTRVAESSSQTVPDGVIGQTEGTMYAEIDFKSKPEAGSPIVGIMTLNNNVSNLQNCIILGIERQSGGTNRFYPFIQVGNSTVAYIIGQTLTDGVYKVAFAYKQNDFILYVNGVQIGTDTNGAVPTTSQVLVGERYNGDTSKIADGIKETKLYNTRLTNAELQALTKI